MSNTEDMLSEIEDVLSKYDVESLVNNKSKIISAYLDITEKKLRDISRLDSSKLKKVYSDKYLSDVTFKDFIFNICQGLIYSIKVTDLEKRSHLGIFSSTKSSLECSCSPLVTLEIPSYIVDLIPTDGTSGVFSEWLLQKIVSKNTFLSKRNIRHISILPYRDGGNNNSNLWTLSAQWS